MRIIVDYDRCQGHGVCMSEAPEVFRVDEKAGRVVLRVDAPPESSRAGVALAVKYCPTHALALAGAIDGGDATEEGGSAKSSVAGSDRRPQPVRDVPHEK